MLKVKDQYGNVLPGLLKDNSGAIVVERDSSYNKYLQTKQQIENINKLNNVVEQQQEAIDNILCEMGEIKKILVSFIEKTGNKG